MRRKALVTVLAAGLLGLLALDLARPPRRQVSGWALVGAIRAYRATLSPWLGAAGVTCRFEPTCSYYAEAVILGDGAVTGSLRAARRLARCGPWTAAGTVDPP